MSFSTEKIREIYRMMLRIRYFEEKATELFTAGEIPGFLHSYLGQEAVAAGVCASLEKDDYITSTHRGHGHVIAKGAQLDKMMAELFGKKTGYCRGKGGSMHIADFSVGVVGAIGIVGAGIPIANGVALASKMKKTDRVVACFFGDGASNQGTFHEGINLASIWNLPVIFICENNSYAESTPQYEHQKIRDISIRAASYSIPGVTVDGNDVLAVFGATEKAVRRARAGDGPSLIEAKTYRWMGHYIGDPAHYRPKGEAQKWKVKCPIKKFSRRLLKERTLKEDELKKVEVEVKKQIEEAVAFARKSPYPTSEEALLDVYSEEERQK